MIMFDADNISLVIRIKTIRNYVYHNNFLVLYRIVSLQKIENMPDKENTEKRGPGRPPKDEKDKKQPYVPTGKPRGRPPKNPKN